MTRIDKKKEKMLDEIKTDAILRTAPGTPLREALNRIQEANLGALIVLGDINELEDVVSGGFQLNTAFSPQKVYELAKMDGAIILSEDETTIHGANIQLNSDFRIQTDESGTRHKAGHRIAQQTGKLVITISERRNKITVYRGKFRYILHSITSLLSKASQAIMALEKYAGVIESGLTGLSQLEIDNISTLYDVVGIIRMYNLLFKMSEEVEEYILELGVEGRLISIQYDEIMLNQKEGFYDVIRDYKNAGVSIDKVYESMLKLIGKKNIDDEDILYCLGYDSKKVALDEMIKARGYRFLRNINKITNKDIELLINEFNDLQAILLSNPESIAKIKGISKFKAEHISKTLVILKSRIMLEK